MNSHRTHPKTCVRCAERGRTCCELSGGDEEFCFPLSEQERERILAAGFSPDSFVRAVNTAPFVEQLDHLMPDQDVELVFAVPGHHWRLATTDAGRCVFLGPQGCLLEREIRPFYCKLFPLWLYRGQLTWFTADECLANDECDSVGAMLVAMGTDAAEIRALFAAMRAALGMRSSKVLS